jgi:DNA-binding winged helix-turn-helix (wHTH) protein
MLLKVWRRRDRRRQGSERRGDVALSDKRVRFDDFELDYSRFQLRRAGKPVRLEGLPLQLLMFMVERRGRLVTREEISGALWSKDVFVDVEQGINTAVRKIRRALADDADEPHYLQTVVGRGYRFVAPTTEEPFGSQSPVQGFTVSAEELGQAIMTAAGLDPENPRGTPKTGGDV